MSFLDTTAISNADIASTYIAGLTVEQRQLKVIKLKAADATTNQAVWIGKIFSSFLKNFKTRNLH